MVWIFHISKLNSQIKKLHERVLGIAYQYCPPSFTKLHENYSARTIHNKIKIKIKITSFWITETKKKRVVVTFSCVRFPWKTQDIKTCEEKLNEDSNWKTKKSNMKTLTETLTFLGPKSGELCQTTFKEVVTVANSI